MSKKKNQELIKRESESKKERNKALVRHVKSLYEREVPLMTKKTLQRIEDCSTFLQLVGDYNLENTKLYRSNNCGNRFCPICAGNKAVKDAIGLHMIVRYIHEKLYKEFIFVTLTAPNCELSQLSDTVNQYNRAFNLMMKRKQFRFVKGYARKLEVTYNSDCDSKSYNTFHPHFHVMVAVNRSYFDDSKIYVSRNEWLRNWQEVMEDDSITQVDVRRIKLSDDGIDGSVLELAKYVSKDSDYLYSDDVFAYFYKGLKSKRFYSYGGVFKAARILLKNGDLDNYAPTNDIDWYWLLTQLWQSDSSYSQKLIAISELPKTEIASIMKFIESKDLKQIKSEF